MNKLLLDTVSVKMPIWLFSQRLEQLEDAVLERKTRYTESTQRHKVQAVKSIIAYVLHRIFIKKVSASWNM